MFDATSPSDVRCSEDSKLSIKMFIRAENLDSSVAKIPKGVSLVLTFGRLRACGASPDAGRPCCYLLCAPTAAAAATDKAFTLEAGGHS